MPVTDRQRRESRSHVPHWEVHVYCERCHPDGAIGLCGKPLTGPFRRPGVKATCVVCVDLHKSPAPCSGCCAPKP